MPTSEETSTESTETEEISAENTFRTEKDHEISAEKIPPAISMGKDGKSDAETEIHEKQLLAKWLKQDVANWVKEGWQYRVKTQASGKQYMTLT